MLRKERRLRSWIFRRFIYLLTPLTWIQCLEVKRVISNLRLILKSWKRRLLNTSKTESISFAKKRIDEFLGDKCFWEIGLRCSHISLIVSYPHPKHLHDDIISFIVFLVLNVLILLFDHLSFNDYTSKTIAWTVLLIIIITSLFHTNDVIVEHLYFETIVPITIR